MVKEKNSVDITREKNRPSLLFSSTSFFSFHLFFCYVFLFHFALSSVFSFSFCSFFYSIHLLPVSVFFPPPFCPSLLFMSFSSLVYYLSEVIFIVRIILLELSFLLSPYFFVDTIVTFFLERYLLTINYII